MFYNNGTVMFEVIDSREDRYAPQLQQLCYADSDQVVLPGEPGDGAEAKETIDCSDVVDEALRYIESAMFTTLNTLVENNQLYTLKDEELNA